MFDGKILGLASKITGADGQPMKICKPGTGKASRWDRSLRNTATATKNKTQLERFKEAARQLETEDDEDRFNENLKKMAKSKHENKKTDRP